MAAIAASDVVYTLQNQEITGGGYSKKVMKIVFGDGALTYPSGGVPLTKGKMGVPNAVRSLKLIDPDDSNGYVYKYDFANNKIRIYYAPAQTHGHDFTIVKGAILASSELGLSADATSATINNDTIAATRVLAKATGPVVSETLAASVLVEIATSVAPAAATLYFEVEGY